MFHLPALSRLGQELRAPAESSGRQPERSSKARAYGATVSARKIAKVEALAKMIEAALLAPSFEALSSSHPRSRVDAQSQQGNLSKRWGVRCVPVAAAGVVTTAYSRPIGARSSGSTLTESTAWCPNARSATAARWPGRRRVSRPSAEPSIKVLVARLRPGR